MPRTFGTSGFAVELDKKRLAVDDLLLSPLRDGQFFDFRLGPYHAILNSIADPDLNPATLALAEQICARSGLPVLNPPESIRNCTRDKAWELAPDKKALLVPKTVRIDKAAYRENPALLDEAGLNYPVICRPAGSHGGLDLVRHDDAASLHERLAADTKPQRRFAPAYYVTEFVDFKSDDGLYRKYRLYSVGRTIIPWRITGADNWEVRVHRQDEDDGEDKSLADLHDEEAAFADDMEAYLNADALAALRALLEKLGVDYCGIDCAILPDGRLVLFEANPNMMIAPPKDEDDPGYDIYMAAYDAVMEALYARIETLGETGAAAG